MFTQNTIWLLLFSLCMLMQAFKFYSAFNKVLFKFRVQV